MEVKKQKPLWVVVFLRGGVDGLSLVYPSKGPDREIYEAARPTLKITPTNKESDFNVTDTLSMHPAAKELHALFEKKSLAVIHAVGLTADSRSHFDAQNLMEQGVESKSHLLNSGWIARYLKRINPSSKIAAVSIAQNSPTSVMTYDHALVLDSIRNYHFPIAPKFEGDLEKSLKQLYALQSKTRPWLSEWGIQTLETLDELRLINTRADDSNYPKNELGGRLQTLAKLLMAKPEIEIATVDMGGWDTHKFQEGSFSSLVGQLSQSLSYFYEDISKHRPVVITVQTEFGRRLKENFSRGTDHGHGGVMMVLGTSVKGGKLYGKWPGLGNQNLYERADLAVTTDYRDVLCEILNQEMGFASTHEIFPHLKQAKPLGIV